MQNFPRNIFYKKYDAVITMTDLNKETDTLGYSAIIPETKNVNYLHNQRIGHVQFKSRKVNNEII